MTRDEFISKNPLVTVLEHHGVKVISGGNQRMAKCPFHEDGSASMSVKVSEGIWYCHACKTGGSVIDLLSKFDNVSAGEVLKRAVAETAATPQPKKENPSEPLKYELVCYYDYTDAFGEMVYQVARLHAPCKDKECGYVKSFRQRHPDTSGGWAWNMDGIQRVLYRLPEVLKAKQVWVVEGEKDADTLVKLGFCATCNVGGAGKWMEAYASDLAKKNVIICGDNDEPGKKHQKAIFDSLVGKAKAVRVLKLNEAFKDVTKFVESFKGENAEATAKRALDGLVHESVPFIRGISLPIYKVSELEPMYQRHVQSLDETAYELKRWLPGLSVLRSLAPGALVLIVGGTGVGKTAVLSNIAVPAWPMPTVFFELELPPEDLYERLVAMKMKMSCLAVETAYKSGETLGEEAIDQKLSHLHICTKSNLTVREIEELVIKSELKIGERPKLILIDYVQLVQCVGKSRYERVSQVAEDLKVMAKSTQTVVVIASQISRPSGDSPEITLTDAKDSGSLENSSGLVLGIWRKDADTMMVKVLKSTKGGAGTTIECNYNLNTLAITERSRFDPT